MNSYVVDTSVAIAWCFEEDSDPAATELLSSLPDHDAFAPAIWPLEVANVLAMSERKGRLSAAALVDAITLLQRLNVRIDQEGHTRALAEILDLARAERLTTYDAAFLELAQRLQLPLATFDAELAAAATRTRVPLLIA